MSVITGLNALMALSFPQPLWLKTGFSILNVFDAVAIWQEYDEGARFPHFLLNLRQLSGKGKKISNLCPLCA
jgi:hypothetical protein